MIRYDQIAAGALHVDGLHHAVGDADDEEVEGGGEAERRGGGHRELFVACGREGAAAARERLGVEIR